VSNCCRISKNILNSKRIVRLLLLTLFNSNKIFRASRQVWNGRIILLKHSKLKKIFWKTVVQAGLLVGSLDIIAALTNFYIKTGKDPLIVLKYIASALFGKAAFSGDNSMAIWGLLLHFMIAFIWTIFFFLIYSKLRLLSWNRIITGIIYGIFIWIVMSQVVVPMSKAAGGPFNIKQAIIAVLILIGAIGLPLSFIAHRYYRVRVQA